MKSWGLVGCVTVLHGQCGMKRAGWRDDTRGGPCVRAERSMPADRMSRGGLSELRVGLIELLDDHGFGDVVQIQLSGYKGHG